MRGYKKRVEGEGLISACKERPCRRGKQTGKHKIDYSNVINSGVRKPFPCEVIWVICGHLVSCGIIWGHVGSFGITWDDLGHLGSCGIILLSFGIIWNHLRNLASFGVVRCHLVSFGII